MQTKKNEKKNCSKFCLSWKRCELLLTVDIFLVVVKSEHKTRTFWLRLVVSASQLNMHRRPSNDSCFSRWRGVMLFFTCAASLRVADMWWSRNSSVFISVAQAVSLYLWPFYSFCHSCFASSPSFFSLFFVFFFTTYNVPHVGLGHSILLTSPPPPPPPPPPRTSAASRET